MNDRDQWCFACGPLNPIGLKLVFREENNEYATTFIAGPEHQGYNGIMHGGLVSTLLDEVMARYIYARGYTAVTARLEVRFREPTPIGQQLTIAAKIDNQRGNMVYLSGSVRRADGTVTAEGKTTIAIIEDVKT